MKTWKAEQKANADKAGAAAADDAKMAAVNKVDESQFAHTSGKGRQK